MCVCLTHKQTTADVKTMLARIVAQFIVFQTNQKSKKAKRNHETNIKINKHRRHLYT